MRMARHDLANGRSARTGAQVYPEDYSDQDSLSRKYPNRLAPARRNPLPSDPRRNQRVSPQADRPVMPVMTLLIFVPSEA